MNTFPKKLHLNNKSGFISDECFVEADTKGS
jgi:hypothetical protein